MLCCKCGFTCGSIPAFKRHVDKFAEEGSSEIAHGSTKRTRQILELKDSFKKLDGDGDSRLNFTEMATLLRRGDGGLSDEDLRQLFTAVDKDNDGCIDFDEFVEHIFSERDGGRTASINMERKLRKNSVASNPSVTAVASNASAAAEAYHLLRTPLKTADEAPQLAPRRPSLTEQRRRPSPPPASRNLSSSVRLLLVRHALSANKSRAAGAASLDPELSDAGYDQAEALGRRLAADFRRTKAGDLVVASSPMRRCILTILPALSSLPLAPGDCLVHGSCYEFACVGTGPLAGSHHKAITAEFPEFKPVGFNANGTWDYRGSNNKETEADARERVYRIVDWIWETAKALSERPRSTTKTLLLATHQTLADLISQLLVDGSVDEWVYGEVKYKLRNTGVTELILDTEGRARFGMRSSCEHLSSLQPRDSRSFGAGDHPNGKQIAKMRAHFRELDKSGDGKLDFVEMSELLRRGDPTLTDAELWSLFDTIDVTHDGEIEFNEFVEYIFAK
mmetsp:Transcript_63335/g.137832  ORF Transcript_63335/g.137832 Transcript_63335/m.137832 type:complete len:507 (-) Transcript_63335:31-1551(-)